MGSSPVTATTPSRADVTLERFLLEVVGWRGDQPLIVAFSGGPDSTALLSATIRVAPGSSVYAAHFNHRLDPDSDRRAAIAKHLAYQLGAEWVCERASEPRRLRRGVEAWARRRRYDFLERTRRRLGARAVLTAHHRQDQAETVLLRILFGSGLRGLAAIRPWIASVGRPWLELPRDAIRNRALSAGVAAVVDPTNGDLTVPRNRVRQLLLPSLSWLDGDLQQKLADVAQAANGAHDALRRRLRERLDFDSGPDVPSIDLQAFAALRGSLWPVALSLLEATTSLAEEAPLNCGQSEIQELRRQLQAGGRVEVSLPGNRRWIAANGRLMQQAKTSQAEPFCRRLELPGEVELPDGGRVTISAAEPAGWMVTGDPHRTALELPPEAALRVRSRRPGDRIQPLGCDYRRKLKDVLIDAKVPRTVRDQLPLLAVDDSPVWVPGVTIDHRFRVRGESRLWVARWHPGQGN